MKIAFVTHDYNRHGGHARYVAELANAFKHKHEVHVYANKWEEDDPDKIKFHKVPAIRLTALTTIITFLIPATWMVNRRQFDIVHSQGLCGLRHDISTAHFIQKRWLDELKERRKNLGLSTFLWKALIAPLEKLALGKLFSKRIIAISEHVKKDLEGIYGIKSENIEIIYHGVDFEKFNPGNKILYRTDYRAQINVNDDKIVGLFVGNLQKGAEYAIRAIAKVPCVHLVIVTGSDSGREKELVKQLCLDSRVHWIPLSKEIEKWFSMADFFVFPTLYEPYGMVISEAMASGLPVITSKSAGAAELITNGESGLLLEDSWSPDEIATAISTLVSDTALRDKMGRKAREIIIKYSWKRCAEETYLVYKKVLNSSGRDE